MERRRRVSYAVLDRTAFSPTGPASWCVPDRPVRQIPVLSAVSSTGNRGPAATASGPNAVRGRQYRTGGRGLKGVHVVDLEVDDDTRVALFPGTIARPAKAAFADREELMICDQMITELTTSLLTRAGLPGAPRGLSGTVAAHPRPHRPARERQQPTRTTQHRAVHRRPVHQRHRSRHGRGPRAAGGRRRTPPTVVAALSSRDDSPIKARLLAAQPDHACSGRRHCTRQCNVVRSPPKRETTAAARGSASPAPSDRAVEHPPPPARRPGGKRAMRSRPPCTPCSRTRGRPEWADFPLPYGRCVRPPEGPVPLVPLVPVSLQSNGRILPYSDELVHVVTTDTVGRVVRPVHVDRGLGVLVADLTAVGVDVDHRAGDVEDRDHLVATLGHAEGVDVAGRVEHLSGGPRPPTGARRSAGAR